MREILFRGKRTYGENKWTYGSLLIRGSEYPEIAVLDTEGREGLCLDFRSVFPETVGQFTGLTDKNGVRIFEGDIFTVCGRSPRLIKFIDKLAAFCIANVDQLKDEKYINIWGAINEVWWNEFGREIEVIGNIHDNPELLET